MSKYDRLGAYLRSQSQTFIPMSFREIESILGARLPPSNRKHRAWWSNNPSNNVMTYQWLNAGYETEAVDMASEKLVFRRVQPSSTPPSATPPSPPVEGAGSWGGSAAAAPPRDPLFGCMKGTLVLQETVDLTAPADADWGKVYEDG